MSGSGCDGWCVGMVAALYVGCGNGGSGTVVSGEPHPPLLFSIPRMRHGASIDVVQQGGAGEVHGVGCGEERQCRMREWWWPQ